MRNSKNKHPQILLKFGWIVFSVMNSARRIIISEYIMLVKRWFDFRNLSQYHRRLARQLTELKTLSLLFMEFLPTLPVNGT